MKETGARQEHAKRMGRRSWARQDVIHEMGGEEKRARETKG